MSFFLKLIKRYFTFFLTGFIFVLLLILYAGIQGDQIEFGYGVALALGTYFVLIESLVFFSIAFITSSVFKKKYSLKETCVITFLAYFVSFSFGNNVDTYLWSQYEFDPYYTLFLLPGILFLIFIFIYTFGKEMLNK